jgi:hypothetical protein
MGEQNVTDKFEELARIIAAAVTGMDPDTRTVSYHPALINNISGYVVPGEQEIRPLWTRFCEAAGRVIGAGFDRPEPKTDEPVPAPESYVQTSLFDQSDAAPPAQDDDWRGRMGLT